MTKAVVLFSGGIDSLAALLWARQMHGPKNVLAIYCDIGHRYAKKEIRAVETICCKLDQDYVIDARLNLANFEKPKEQNAIIPYRNTFFILMASLYLPKSGGVVILQNVVKGESSTIDRRKEFNENLQKFLPFADNKKVKIIAPHEGLTKGDICHWIISEFPVSGSRLLMDTIGCYSEGTGNCGECNSCFRSWVALEWAGIKDISERFNKDPSLWTDGITNYIKQMTKGKYDKRRVSQTFSVLRKHNFKIPFKTYVFDLDGVLTKITEEQACMENGEKEINLPILMLMYKEATPNLHMIQKLQHLYSDGNKIIICTARHSEDREITEEWLRENNIPYDELIMDKPHGHFYIDDRALSVEDL